MSEADSDLPVIWTGIGLTAAAMIGVVAWMLLKNTAAPDDQAELAAKCEKKDKLACATLCSRTPTDPNACLVLGKELAEGTGDEAARAVKLFAKACLADSPEGCARLGRAQYNGKGTSRDLEQAERNFERACDADNALGCAGLGHALLFGRSGKGAEPKRGVALAEKACEQGEQRGCALLGLASLNGIGVPRDAEKAKEYFDTACRGDEKRGCLGLAVLEYHGQGGTERSPETAVKKFREFCAGELEDACAYVGMAHLSGIGAERNVKKALSVLERACDRAPPAGCALLGELYAGAGLGRPEPEKAVSYFERACNHGLPDGCAALGRALVVGGAGVRRDEGRGVKLVQDSCASGSPHGCTTLALFEVSGSASIERNVESAVKRATQSCDAAFPPACTLLGGLIVQGAEGKPDVERAAKLFEKGCAGGDGNGCAYFGAQVVEGQGVKRDVAAGLSLLERSCDVLGSLQGCAMHARALVLGAGGRAAVKDGAERAEQLCQMGEVQSCLIAGVAYGQGTGVKKDIPRAAALVVRACAAGFPPACEVQKRLPKPVVERAVAELKAALGGANSPAPAPTAPEPAQP